MSTTVIRLLLPFFDSAQRASSPSCKIEVKDPKKDESTFVLKAQKAIAEGGAVTANRLDGSSYADARLLARNGDLMPGEAPTAEDRAIAEDDSAPVPAREAARLRLSLKNAKTNKKHTS